MKEKRYFQWLDGEHKGDVVSLESISELDGEVFYNFDDDESCNLRFISKMTNNVVDLKGKFMVEVESPHNAWTFDVIETSMPLGINADSGDVVPTLHDLLNSNAGAGAAMADITDSDLGKDKLVPPRRKQNLRPLPDKESYKEDIKSPVIKEKAEPAKPVDEIPSEPVQHEQSRENVHEEPRKEPEKSKSIDPVSILVDSCKKHSTEIPITITIDLPIKSLYMIAESEFEDGGKKFIDYIVEGIDTKIIIDAIKVALSSAYGAVKTQPDDESES